MVAYTDSFGFYKNSAGFAANYTDRVSVVEIDLDFAKIAAARSAAGVAALGSADTLVIGVLPKGALVLGGVGTLVRAEGAAANVDVGVGGGTVDFWLDGFDLNAAVGTTGGIADNAAYYCAANTNVLLTLNSASIDAARVKVSLVVVNMGADLGVIPNVT
jgi:hypothetical protein